MDNKKYGRRLCKNSFDGCITTLRTVGGLKDLDGKTRDKIKDRNILGQRIVTLNSTILVGVGKITGSIEVGKEANMIVIKENPLENLEALRKVEMVITRGTLISHPKVKRNSLID